MKSPIPARLINSENSSCRFNIEIDLPNQCPHCLVAYKDKPIDSFIVDDGEDALALLYSLFFCPHCDRCFMLAYPLERGNIQGYDSCYPPIYYPAPSCENLTMFDKGIQELSPEFIEIYHQSEKAESNGFNKICGMGYRKALEFLIKDYAIFLHASNAAKIKEMPLSQCIKQFVDNQDIQSLAMASAWIGNDETHYVRQHEDRDSQDLKTFIEVLTRFISMNLILKDAKDFLEK
jgi:hypothetical protein